MGGERARPRKRPHFGFLRILLLLAFAKALVLVTTGLAPLDPLESRTPVPGMVILGADGTVISRDTARGLRIPVTLDRVAPAVIEATIAAEDGRFYEHQGIDPVAMLRAAVKWPREPSGASTITQQLARRLFLSTYEGSRVTRKLHEFDLAMRIEARYTKDEILEAYLNDVFYGHGAYGIEAAARVYFGVSARDLDLARAAFLAGLPQAPGQLDPFVDPDAARARQAYVLGRLEHEGRISAEELAAASTAAIVLRERDDRPVGAHFVRLVEDEIDRLFPGASHEGLVVETTLDAGLQREAEALVEYHLGELRRRGANAGNAGVVVLEPGSGRILAMVGSRDFFDAAGAGQVNMATALRQPGSALKPFLYAAAFEAGFTPATPLLDIPTSVETREGLYNPQNSDRRFHGVVPLRTALASSYNVPAVRILEEVGLESFLAMLHRFGLDTLSDVDRYGPALALGAGEVRLLDLTAAYAALATLGRRPQPFAIVTVRDHTGAILWEHRPARGRPALDPANAWILGDVLSDSVARAPGFGQATVLDLPFRAAAKTGTTTNFRDNWAVGFTPHRAVGVWVGNADGTPMENVSGIDGAGPIWAGVMKVAMAGQPRDWPEPPANLIRATVCSPTGLLPGPDCPSRVEEWFRAGSAPDRTETYYVRLPDGRLAVDPPVEAQGWMAGEGWLLASPRSEPGRSVQIVQPADGTVFVLAPELGHQELLIRAAGPPGMHSLLITVDGQAVRGGDGSAARAVWHLTPGAHLIEARGVLPTGETVRSQTRYEVRSP